MPPTNHHKKVWWRPKETPPQNHQSHHKTTTIKTQSDEQSTVSKSRANITYVKPPPENSLAQTPVLTKASTPSLKPPKMILKRKRPHCGTRPVLKHHTEKNSGNDLRDGSCILWYHDHHHTRTEQNTILALNNHHVGFYATNHTILDIS
jgi:hypothetical protein